MRKIVVHHKRNSSGSGSIGLFIGWTFDESSGARPWIQKLSRGSGSGSGEVNVPKTKPIIATLCGQTWNYTNTLGEENTVTHATSIIATTTTTITSTKPKYCYDNIS